MARTSMRAPLALQVAVVLMREVLHRERAMSAQRRRSLVLVAVRIEGADDEQLTGRPRARRAMSASGRAICTPISAVQGEVV